MGGGAAVAALMLGLAAAASAATVRDGHPVMGTVLAVTVVAADAATADALTAAAFAEARRWDDVLTTWRPEGELARLNARAGAGPVAISPDLAAALRLMVRLAAATDGGFDPAVGALARPRRPAAAAARERRDAHRDRADARRRHGGPGRRGGARRRWRRQGDRP
jgi:thiamine biosynthesis lipoprotein ApbE